MFKYPGLFLLLIGLGVKGQGLEAGFGGGVSHYKGDLRPVFNVLKVNPGLNVFARYNINPALSIKASALASRLSANDVKFKAPLNLSREFTFSTLMWEGSGQFEYNFENFRENQVNNKFDWTPYLFAGYAWYQMLNMRFEQKYINASTLELVTEDSRRVDTSVPFGVGFKKRKKGNWNWGVEFGARKTFSDVIDNLGYLHDKSPNLQSSVSGNNLLLQKYSVPNTRLNDMYFYTNIYLSYVFYKVNCPNPKR